MLFRKAVKASHPDRFKKVFRDNAVLSDPELRAVYDRMLEFEHRQHQQPSMAYNVVPDAIVALVLAIVMAGGYTLYMNLPEISAYLPKISIAKVGDAARESSAVVAQPAAPVEADISDRARVKPESANTPSVALSSAATAEAAHASVNVAPPSSPADDANTSASPLDKFQSEASAPSAVAQTENSVVAIHEPASAAPSPLADAKTSGSPRDRGKGAITPVPGAVAPAPPNGGNATGKVAPAPNAVTPSTSGTAAEKNPSTRWSGSAPIKDATFYRDQGIESYRNGDLPMAIANFDHAIQLDPNFEEAYIDRGIALYRLLKFDRAFADVAQAIRIQNSHRAAATPLP
jgi:tetratricopeptide (TPR) repeat protein